MYEAELTLARRAVDTYRDVLSHQHTKAVTNVKARGDFATESDEAVERAVAGVLAEAGLPIQGEEYSGGEVAATRWVIDPIDGTFNYAVGIPIHGFTVCLVDHDEPVVGIVVAAGEAVEAVKGQGSTAEGAPAHTTTSSLTESCVMMGDFTTVQNSLYPNDMRLACLRAVGGVAAKTRIVGSAAADLSWVSVGRAAGSLLYSNHPWDMAAGVLAVREAGGTVLDIEGNEWSLESTSVLAAANDTVASELLTLVRSR